MKKKLFSALLALCMVLSLLPTAALAAAGGSENTLKLTPACLTDGTPDSLESLAGGHATSYTAAWGTTGDDNIPVINITATGLEKTTNPDEYGNYTAYFVGVGLQNVDGTHYYVARSSDPEKDYAVEDYRYWPDFFTQTVSGITYTTFYWTLTDKNVKEQKITGTSYMSVLTEAPTADNYKSATLYKVVFDLTPSEAPVKLDRAEVSLDTEGTVGQPLPTPKIEAYDGSTKYVVGENEVGDTGLPTDFFEVDVTWTFQADERADPEDFPGPTATKAGIYTATITVEENSKYTTGGKFTLEEGYAYKYNGQTENKVQVTVNEAPATAPDAPTGLTAAPGDGQVTLNWTAPVADGGSAITHYVITVTPAIAAPDSGEDEDDTPGDQTDTQDPAQGGDENDAPGDQTDTQDPAQGGDENADQTPKAQAEDESGPTITHDPEKTTITIAAESTSYTVTGLTNGTEYSFTVAAKNAAGTGTATEAVTATPAASTAPPPSSSGGNNSSTTPSTPSTPSTTDKETTVNVTPTVKDDTVSATVSDRTANQLVNEAVKNESETVVVKVETPKNTDATEAQVSLPASAVAGLAEKTDASLTVDTSVAAVTIDNAALADLGKDAESVTVTATVSAEEETGNQTVTIAVAKDGEAVSDLGGALKADVPVASLSEQEDATLTVDMPTVNVTLDSAAVADLSKDAETITVGATVTNDAETGEKLVNITVGKDGKASEQIDGSLKVTIPVEEAAPGSVAILVNADGTETIIKKSSVVDGSLDVVLNGSATLKIVDNSKDFDDTEGHWAKDSIDFVSSRELFQGTSANTFDADMTMNRAMLVTVLHRLENTPAGGKVEFPDVTEDTWYTEAVAWGASNGIVTGTGAGFNPDGAVTREQIATFLYRYAKAVNANTELTASFENFTDGGEVSSWAAEAMAWAIGAGIIQGTDGNALNPSGEATRGEVSTMLMRLIEFLH